MENIPRPTWRKRITSGSAVLSVRNVTCHLCKQPHGSTLHWRGQSGREISICFWASGNLSLQPFSSGEALNNQCQRHILSDCSESTNLCSYLANSTHSFCDFLYLCHMYQTRTLLRLKSEFWKFMDSAAVGFKVKQITIPRNISQTPCSPGLKLNAKHVWIVVLLAKYSGALWNQKHFFKWKMDSIFFMSIWTKLDQMW